jgi:hypothetical protein
MEFESPEEKIEASFVSRLAAISVFVHGKEP